MAPPDTPDTLLVISASMKLAPPDSETPLPSLHTPCSSAPRLCVSAFTVEVASVAASNPSRWSSLTRVANRAPFSAKRRLGGPLFDAPSQQVVVLDPRGEQGPVQREAAAGGLHLEAHLNRVGRCRPVRHAVGHLRRM